MKILEDLWYGNIDTTKYDLLPDKEYAELLQRLCDIEENLKATMTDEQKKLFLQYMDDEMELLSLEECRLFQNSFRLGARMMLEVTSDN